jgi:hypothetical protein
VAKVKNAWLSAGKLGPTMGKPGNIRTWQAATYTGGMSDNDLMNKQGNQQDSGPTLNDKYDQQRQFLEDRKAEQEQRRLEQRERAKAEADKAAKDKAFQDLSAAAQRDFDQQRQNISEANQARQDYADESAQFLRDNVSDTEARTRGYVNTADEEAQKIRDEFKATSDKILSGLETRNQQAQAEQIAGVTTGLQSQLDQVDQKLASGAIGQAEAAELKRQVRQQGSSQAAQIAGQAEAQFQQLFAQTSTALSAQGTQVQSGAANMRMAARFQRQQDNAAAVLAASSGMRNLAQLMFEPARHLGELDSMMALANIYDSMDGSSQYHNFNGGGSSSRGSGTNPRTGLPY